MKANIVIALTVTAATAAVFISGTPDGASAKQPENVGTPFNVPGYYDFEITYSTDGKTAVWASNRPGGQGGNDIYFAEFKNGAWGPAVNAGPAINSGVNEQEPSLSDDGELLYFTRYHDPNNMLSGDLYVSRKVNGQWQTAQNWNDVPELPAINTADGEEHCPIVVNKDLIYFSTNRKGTQASDIWMVERKNGVWGEARSMGPDINSPNRDHLHWTGLSKDGRSMIIISDRPDRGSIGKSDQWIVRMDDKGHWGAPTNLGPLVNSGEDEICWTSPPDAATFGGATKRFGLSMGALYYVNRADVPALQGFVPNTRPPLNLLKYK